MAFSATVQNTQYVGPGQTTLTGTWSGASGDAAGTMTIAGVVVSAIFESFDVDNAWQIMPRVSVSSSGGISTVTVNNLDDVASGYFTIRKLGG